MAKAKKKAKRNLTPAQAFQAVPEHSKLDSPRKVYASFYKDEPATPRNLRILFGSMTFTPPGGKTSIDPDEPVRVIGWQMGVEVSDPDLESTLKELPVHVGPSRIVIAQPKTGTVEQWDEQSRSVTASKKELLNRIDELEHRLEA